MWLLRRLLSKLNTPTDLVSKGWFLSLRFEQSDWVVYWLDPVDVKHRSHIPHLTENTGCKSQHLPTGLGQKCYFHCSDAPLFLYLCQSSFKLFSSSKFWPTSCYHPLLFPPFLPSSPHLFQPKYFLPTLIAYPCFPSLQAHSFLLVRNWPLQKQHVPKTVRSNLSTQTEQTWELLLKRKTCLPMRHHAPMICSIT